MADSRLVRSFRRVGAALAGDRPLLVAASGDEPVKEGGWLQAKDDKTGVTIQTMEMTLYPATNRARHSDTNSCRTISTDRGKFGNLLYQGHGVSSAGPSPQPARRNT